MAAHEPSSRTDARAGGSADEQVTGSLERLNLDEASGGSRADELRDVAFPVALRGYDREAVDAYVDRVSRLVADLEASRSPEEAVRRALDQVGEETSGILQRAQETASEITARSRAQADDRLREAEREAAAVTAEAAERVRELDADFGRIWDQRDQLLEEVRQLAERLLSVADDAEERWSTQREEEVEEGGAPSTDTASFPAAESDGRSAAAVDTGSAPEPGNLIEGAEEAFDFGEVYDHETDLAEPRPGPGRHVVGDEESSPPAPVDPVSASLAGGTADAEPSPEEDPTERGDADHRGSEYGREGADESSAPSFAESPSERGAGRAS